MSNYYNYKWSTTSESTDNWMDYSTYAFGNLWMYNREKLLYEYLLYAKHEIKTDILRNNTKHLKII